MRRFAVALTESFLLVAGVISKVVGTFSVLSGMAKMFVGADGLLGAVKVLLGPLAALGETILGTVVPAIAGMAGPITAIVAVLGVLWLAWRGIGATFAA